jgi:hypothetical protein
VTRLGLDIVPGPEAFGRRSIARKAIAERLAALAAEAVREPPPVKPRSRNTYVPEPAARPLPPVSLEVAGADRHPPLALHQLLDGLRRAAGLTIDDLAVTVESTTVEVSEVLGGGALPGQDFLEELLAACRASPAQRMAARDLLRPRSKIDPKHGFGHALGDPRGAADSAVSKAAGRSFVVLHDSELLIRNPADLARVFQLVLDRAGLTAGQLAIKTKISRSQIYNLKKAGTTAVPRSAEQVSKYLLTCGMAPRQVQLVLERWHVLDVLRRQGRKPEVPVPEEPAPPCGDLVVGDHAAAAALPEPELSAGERAVDVHRTEQPQRTDTDSPGRETPAPGRPAPLLAGLADVLVTEYGAGLLVRRLLIVLLLVVIVVALVNLGTSSLFAHFGTAALSR